MRIGLFLLLLCLCGNALSQYLLESEHSTQSGRAELNSFAVNCTNDCYFTMFLEVSKMDFESEFESGAMYRVWNKDRTEFILFGVDANKQTKSPQITIVSSSDTDKKVLGDSELGSFEGFLFKWKDGIYTLNNLRYVKMDGYSMLQESEISYENELPFSPHSVEYLFLGVNVKQYVDASSQNVNSELKAIVNGS